MNTKYLDSGLYNFFTCFFTIFLFIRGIAISPLSLSPPLALSDSPSLQHSQDDYTLRLYTPGQRKGVKRLGFLSRHSTCGLQVKVTRMAGKLIVPEIVLENGANFHAGLLFFNPIRNG